ncbi:MAG: V-type ATPase subunit [Acutalibacteraceae bacterium]
MKVKDTDYAFAVARIRANERNLLNQSDIQTVISCETYKKAIDFLASKGWVSDSKESADSSVSSLIDEQSRSLWSLLSESVPDKKMLEVFTVQNDFYNIKAALKCSFENKEVKNYFAYPTSLDTDLIEKAVSGHNFDLLGESFSKAAKEAYNAACTTQSGQSADIILDSAALKVMSERAKKNDCEMVREIISFMCLCANLKIAVRCARTGKSASFAKEALFFEDEKDTNRLAELCENGEKDVLKFFENSEVSEGAVLIEKDTAAFEKWCDDKIIEKAKKAKFVFFGFEPICAYYYAKQSEIKTVRIILGAKESGLSEEVIRRRVRELYV